MITASAIKAQPAQWQNDWRQALTSPIELLNSLGLSALAARVYQPNRAQFPLRVPRSFVNRMRLGDENDPLLRQVLPLTDELKIADGYSFDAVGDLASAKAPGVLHKYHGRVLLVTTGSCAVHCRYCFRRHFPYNEANAGAEQWQPAIRYIAENNDIEEVILSGGDPLSLSTEKLTQLTAQLANIKHIQRLRIHTRLPVVLPSRIDSSLLHWLSNLPWPSTIVLHVNHANELAAEVPSMLAQLRGTGAHLLNQSVLLAGVNDNAVTLTELCKRLHDYGVLPYYLHLLDKVQGASHFAVGVDHARHLERALRNHLPGYLVPRFVAEFETDPSKRPLSQM